MDLISDRGRRVTIEELNTSRLLAHARKQAVQRKLDDMLIVDVDAHHYESENYREFLPYMENDVLKQLAMQGIAKGSRGALTVQNVGYQDMGGRVTRYPLRSSEKTEGAGGRAPGHSDRPPGDGGDGDRLPDSLSDADVGARPPPSP